MSTPQPVGVANSGNMLLWNDGNGAFDLWVSVNNGDLSTHYTYGPYPGWSALAVTAGADQVPRILWTKTDGSAALWSVNPSNGTFTQTTYGPYPGWTARGLAVGGDNVPRVMWTNTDGTMSLWRVATDGTFTSANYGPYTGYTASLIAAGPNSTPCILWTKSDGSISLWNDVAGAADYVHTEYGPYSGWTAVSLAVDANNAPRILWSHPSDSTESLWNVAPGGGFTQKYYSGPQYYRLVGVGSGVSSNLGGDAQLLYAASDGTTDIARIFANGPVQSSYSPPTPSSTGGGGGGGGGGTTATPNPHGQYVFNGYSGGTLTSSDGSASVTPPGPISSNNSIDAYPDAANVYGGSATFSGYHTTATNASVQLGGTIYASFKWQADAGYAGSPTPAQVTVIQRCTASWSMSGYTSGFSGQCNSGLSPAHGFVSGTYSDSAGGIGSTGVVNNPGQGFTVSCSPSAIVSGFEGGTSYQCSYGTVNFAYTAAAVTMNLAGVTPDAKGNDHILIGQRCSASLDSIPSSLTRNIKWSVGGQTVQKSDWVVSSDRTQAVFLGPNAAYTYTQANSSTSPPSWYWDDYAATETVSCTATITPPTGQGVAFPITGSQNVVLDVPTYQNHEPIGVVQLNTHHYSQPGYPWLSAGGGDSNAPLAEQADGITFDDTVSPPISPAPAYKGPGTWYHTQLVSVSRFETKTGAASAIPALGNSVTGALDYAPGPSYVYVGTFKADGTNAASQQIGADNDNPALPVYDAYQEYSVKNEKFQDYIMYTPPTPPVGDSIDVPLFYYQWSWNVDVRTPSLWSNWNDAPTSGTITPPSGTQRMFIYPTWSSLRNLNWASP